MKILAKLIAAAIMLAAVGALAQQPKVYVESVSLGDSGRNQSMEMVKDLQQYCPEIIITLNVDDADYKLSLNHIQVLWSRDNQVSLVNKNDEVLKVFGKNSIKNNMKLACQVIQEDFKSHSPEPPPPLSVQYKVVFSVKIDNNPKAPIGYDMCQIALKDEETRTLVQAKQERTGCRQFPPSTLLSGTAPSNGIVRLSVEGKLQIWKVTAMSNFR